MSQQQKLGTATLLLPEIRGGKASATTSGAAMASTVPAKGKKAAGGRKGKGKTPDSTTTAAPQEAQQGEGTLAVTMAQRLCVDLLVRGHTKSFIDFFLLTHRLRDPASAKGASGREGDSGDEQGSKPMFILEARGTGEEATERLRFMKEHLAESESATRAGDLKRAAGAYSMLAEHFESVGAKDAKAAGQQQQQQQAQAQSRHSMGIAVHFHEKALAIAKQIGDAGLEATSHRSLGACRHRMGDVAGAIGHYERFGELAAEAGDEDMLAVARKQLIVVYKSMADECEQGREYDRAVAFYGKCLTCAEAAKDAESAGLAHYRLGLCHKQLKQPDESIKHLQAYLELCRQTHDEIGEGLACSALAAAHQNANELERSIKFLEENFALAKRTNQLDAQATACCNLGVIYNKNGDFHRAAAYFEQFFALARQIGDARMLDSARIHLGVAKGNIKLAEFTAAASACSKPDGVLKLLCGSFGSATPVP